MLHIAFTLDSTVKIFSNAAVDVTSFLSKLSSDENNKRTFWAAMEVWRNNIASYSQLHTLFFLGGCFSSTCQQISIVYVVQWASGINQNSVMTS